MHKILIVEDDAMYRYAVKSLIDCSDGALGFLPDAINGKHALSIMKKEMPDIIITDISMTEMNGVELIKSVKASRPEIKILALSAYDDFAFVKDALKYGAEDYILKYDLEEADLDAVVRGLGEKIDRERAERGREEYIRDHRDAILEDFLAKALRGDMTEQEEIERNLACLFPDQDRTLFSVAVMASSGDPRASADAVRRMEGELSLCRFTRLEERDLFAVLVNLSAMGAGPEARTGLESLARRMARRVEHVTGFRTDIAVSLPTADCGELASLFRTAERLLERRFYYEISRVFLPVPDGPAAGPDCFRPSVDSLLAALEAGDAAGVEGSLKELFGLLEERKPDMRSLDATVGEMLGTFLAATKRAGIDFESLTGLTRWPLRALDIAASLGGLKRTLSGWFSAFLEAGGARPGYRRREVRAAMDYIRRNFRSNIQLPDLAGSMGLSPNYLCGIFKKETGMRIFEYVKKVRIEEAVRLLKTTGFKVYEIAEKTGFNNVPYFCRTFRAVTGRSLSELRRDPG